jgi:hypothetical protein
MVLAFLGYYDTKLVGAGQMGLSRTPFGSMVTRVACEQPVLKGSNGCPSLASRSGPGTGDGEILTVLVVQYETRLHLALSHELDGPLRFVEAVAA